MKRTPIKLEDVSLDPEKYYMFFPGHFGDTFSEVGFVKWFEEAVGGKVVCLVQPEQELIMRLFGRENYEIVHFDFKKIPLFSKRMVELSNLCVTPCKGKLFIAYHAAEIHPEVRFMKLSVQNRWENIAIQFRAPYPPPASAFQQPTDKHIVVSDAFKSKITSLAPLDKIVLLCPQSLSWNYPGWYSLSHSFWENAAKTWTERGFIVIVSSVDPFEFENAVYIPMTMEESLWLGIHCYYVVARRSGYVDVLGWFRDTMTIVYSSYQMYATGSLLQICNKRFHEIILPEAAEKAEENKRLENKRKADAEANQREQMLINKIGESFFNQSDNTLQKWQRELENAQNNALSGFISAMEKGESTALENRRKADEKTTKKVQVLINKIGESFINRSEKSLQKWQEELENTQNNALSEFISAIKAGESTVLENWRKTDEAADERVQTLINKISESFFNQSDTLLQKWQEELENTQNSALSEFISAVNAGENAALENRRKVDEEAAEKVQVLINKIGESFFNQSDKSLQKWQRKLENTQNSALSEFISAIKVGESTALENRKKADEKTTEKVQVLIDKIGESFFNQSDKLFQKWQRELENTQNSALSEFISAIKAGENSTLKNARELILFPFTWLNLQRCRLGSHLFFGSSRRHYMQKKRLLRKRIAAVTQFLHGRYKEK